MKIFLSNQFSAFMTLSVIACLSIFCISVSADSVTGEVSAKGTVQSITDSELKLKEGGSIPLAKVRKIEFDGFPVAAKDTGVFLKDGTKLTGVFRDASEGQIFRSTSLGPIKLKNDDIAAVFYEP